MKAYGSADVQRLTGLRSTALRAIIRAGHVSPQRGTRGRYEFSFQDLLVCRMARGLASARVPARNISRSLQLLRQELPAHLPLSGLSIAAEGERVVVREPAGIRDLLSGQYLLGFSAEMQGKDIRILELTPQISLKTGGDCEAAFREACQLDDGEEMIAALEAYQRCLEVNAAHVDARINCGRLLHLSGRLSEAVEIYKAATERDTTLLFNLAVALQDLERDEEAISVYRQVLESDPDFADAHYNLALLHERAGMKRECIRHLIAYRRIMNG